MNLLLYPDVAVAIENLLRNPYASQLFFGPAGTGKVTLAREIARKLNCSGCDHNSCHSCMMADAGHHPDILVVRPDEKKKIGIEPIQSLQKQLSLSKYHAQGIRAVIIEDADTMTIAAQNALLKTLEEPPYSTLIILTGTNKTSLLATIQSRCQNIFIPRQPIRAVAEYLQVEHGITEQTAQAVSKLSYGSVGQALQYARNAELFLTRQKVEELVDSLMSPRLFTRLQAAGALALSKTNLNTLTLILVGRIKIQLEASPEFGNNLEAVESFRRRLSANINPKTAYEALAVELSC